MTKNRVRMTVFNEEQCEQVVNAIYQVLENTGIAVRNEEARGLLSDAGATVDGELVKIPRSIIQKAIETVPKELKFYDRDGNVAINMTRDGVFFAPGLGTVETIDLETGEQRAGNLQDAINAALICDALPNVDFAAALTSVSADHANLADVYEVYALLANTSKPFIFWAEDIRHLEYDIAMIDAVCGEGSVSERPHALCLNCPMDPLVQSQEALEQIMYMARRNIPQFHVAGLFFGGDCPIHLAGANVLGIADVLVGLAVSQLANPGAPFIIGKYNDNMDMRTGNNSKHNPENILSNAGSGDIFRYLGVLSSENMGGDTDQTQVDMVAAFDVCLQQYTAMMSGTNLNIGMGGFGNAVVGYLPGLIFANESLGFLKHITNGIEVTEETLSVDIIDEVGPGGQYIDHDSTLDYFQDLWAPDLFTTHARGVELDDSKYVNRALRIIEAGPKNPLSAERLSALEAVLADAESRG